MRNWMASRTLMSIAALAAMTVACGDDNGTTPPPEDPLVMEKHPTESGDGQTGGVGEVLPDPLQIVITQTDVPQSGVAVTWATPNGGTLAPTTSNTDANGVAATAWTLGPAPGSQTATATVTGAEGSPASFTATAADATPPLEMAKHPTESGDGQTGGVGELLPAPLQIVITQADVPQSGVAVTWATPNGGTLDPSTSNTDANGVAATSWTLGPEPGSQTATATVADAEGSPASFTATAEDDTPVSATVQVLGPTGGNRFSPTEVTIQAGQTVRWVWPSGSLDHNVVPDDTEPTSSGSLEDGPADYSFTFTTAGTYNFFCANHGGIGGVGMSGRVIVQP